MSLPLVLQSKKVSYEGSMHTYTFIRESERYEWEEVVEVNGLLLKWAIRKFTGQLLEFLDQHDFRSLCRTKFVIGECLMWNLFTHCCPDLAITMPVLRTLKSSRLLEREVVRQEIFEDGLGRALYLPWHKLALQEWGRGLHQLCEEIPLVLDGVADERSGDKVQNIRKNIASQWARTIEMAREHGPDSIIIKERISEMNLVLDKLIREYAQVLAFSPDPDLSRIPVPKDMESPKTGSPSESSMASSPSGDQKPFDIKFLQVGDDVWTVLQSADSCDGYVLFVSVAEWWRFKTPFYAWFSRSYESVGRRSGYRGSVKNLPSWFPLDVTTLPAMASTLATLLAAKGLGRPLLECSYKILKGLGDATLITETYRLLPSEEGCWIDVVNGRFSKSELKSVLDSVDVEFARRGSGSAHCDLELAVEIWHAHCDLELADEVRQCPLRSGAGEEELEAGEGE
eukprot:s46_g8.t1